MIRGWRTHHNKYNGPSLYSLLANSDDSLSLPNDDILFCQINTKLNEFSKIFVFFLINKKEKNLMTLTQLAYLAKKFFL